MAQVEITAMTFGPFGVGRLDGKAVMVAHAAPGDLLEVTVVQERAGYLIARAERVLKADAARVRGRDRVRGDRGRCRSRARSAGSASSAAARRRRARAGAPAGRARRADCGRSAARGTHA